MSTISTLVVPREALVGTFFRGIGRALKNCWIAYVTWRLEGLAIRRLRSMSDRQLQDIGIARASIEFAVKGGRADRHPMLKRYF